MPAHFQYTHYFSLPADRMAEVLLANFNPLGYCWRWQVFARLQVMFDLVKDPGITNGRTAYHHPIYPKPFPGGLCLFRGTDITVPENGYFDPGVVLYFTNKGPVCTAFIHLSPGTA